MPESRFIQIHTLHGYPAALLNRDESGAAKSLSYGGTRRTRLSSQSLKRSIRMAEGEHALSGIEGAVDAVRSRETITRRVMEPRKGTAPDEVLAEIEEGLHKAVYGKQGTDRESRQPLLLGDPEIAYLGGVAEKIAAESGGDPAKAKAGIEAWSKDTKANMAAMRETCQLPGGLVSALFGRMVTSDPAANIDAAVHVQHSFTVHAAEIEVDYFSVVEDLRRPDEDPGAAHLSDTELTAGLFYGYGVVDRGTLLANLGGDTKMAGEIVRHLIHLTTTVSPGAKKGSTAPYSYAGWVMVEAGQRQPRSLAEAFRVPSEGVLESAVYAVTEQVHRIDAMYGPGEQRRCASLVDVGPECGGRMTLPEVAAWAGEAMTKGAV